jgi:FkbM family methyltransferase
MMLLRKFVRTTLLRMGWELRSTNYPGSEDIILKRFLDVVRPDTIFDVGANTGQYAIALRKNGFTGRIVSFEAIPSVHAKLAAATTNDPNWIAAPCCALGRAAGKSQINVAANSWSSSLLPMTKTHVAAEPDSKYVDTQTVRVERLDEIARSLLPENGELMLKIDTQGYEEEVLAGAIGILESVSAMQLELSLVPLYQGAPTLRRMLDLCESLGFELHGVIPGFYDMKTARLLQMDGLFIKASPR